MYRSLLKKIQNTALFFIAFFIGVVAAGMSVTMPETVQADLPSDGGGDTGSSDAGSSDTGDTGDTGDSGGTSGDTDASDACAA